MIKVTNKFPCNLNFKINECNEVFCNNVITFLSLKMIGLLFFLISGLNITIPSFSGDSYITYPTLSNSFNSFTISITFNPVEPNGLILFNSLSNFSDYVSLALIDSHIAYRYDLGSGNATILSNEPVSLNTWHTVSVSRLGVEGSLIVDDQNVVSGTSGGIFTGLQLDDVLWLGGYRHFVNISSFTGVENGFSGCISSLEINGKQVDLVMEAESGLGVGECNSSSGCNGNPCLNGGTCVPVGNSFACECPLSHMGPLCASDVDHCSSDPCLNGGTCVEHSNGTGFSCLCEFGYEGELCNQGECFDA